MCFLVNVEDGKGVFTLQKCRNVKKPEFGLFRQVLNMSKRHYINVEGSSEVLHVLSATVAMISI